MILDKHDQRLIAMNQIDQRNRQAKIQEKNNEISAMFQKNLAFFRSAAPSIYEEYKNYKPKHLRLSYTPEGYINLVNTSKGNEAVYPENPDDYFRKYLDIYERNSKVYRIEFGSVASKLISKDSNNYHVDKIIDFMNEKLPPDAEYSLDASATLMVVLGIGLGYHLLPLLKKTDVKNLFIIEPNKDIFYASLHTMDWPKINEMLAKPGYTLNIQIGQSEAEATKILERAVLESGPYIAAKTYLVEHIKSDEMSSTTKHFLGRLSSTASALGYFDDERIGLAHTISNIKNQIPCMSVNSSVTESHRNLPVFVVGNGPSLDEAKEFLLENQSKAIIISCGSTLGSLEKIGLKPDIHVEQERPRLIFEWLKVSTSNEFRKGVTLVALNTVHPGVFSLFERKAMAMKPLDVGTSYSQSLIKSGKHITQAPYCNPTVTNAGVSIAVSLGFRDIYIFGTDLGFSPNGEHHSKFSTHQKLKEQFNDSIGQVNSDKNVFVPGNFCDKIETTKILNSSRLSMEMLIASSPSVRFFNASNGARIEGATPTRIESIMISEEISDKKAQIDSIYTECFKKNLFNFPKSESQIARHFSMARGIYEQSADILNGEIESIEDAESLIEELQSLYGNNNAATLESQYCRHLVLGSSNIFNTLLRCAITRSKDLEKSLNAFRFSANEYLHFLNGAITRMRTNFLEHDTKESNLAEKLEVES